MNYLIVKLDDGRYALVSTVAIFTEDQLSVLVATASNMLPKDEEPAPDKDAE